MLTIKMNLILITCIYLYIHTLSIYTYTHTTRQSLTHTHIHTHDVSMGFLNLCFWHKSRSTISKKKMTRRANQLQSEKSHEDQNYVWSFFPTNLHMHLCSSPSSIALSAIFNSLRITPQNTLDNILCSSFRNTEKSCSLFHRFHI